ncbi:hypothetical protein AAZX31_05G050700 [Glycine max]|uniref:DUF1442 domain-containing protein n=2 Tax=Glycine subgen. Soja TaxID=1462606 RepID=I1K0H6_SOYBN|nr:uncharacterized protein LOC100788494 [Glycine max]XP_028231682.1 uncharacterized protein LOC114412102 [Glycine soja]KAH1132911.1 hypothetical protein GYH30_011650 [Glycine max]KRH57302.1 hypothetical protein GLYMA_05G052800v4 [Glycine max]RZC11065.1 hypothetical protein D0Y65_011348 [Glycine soja]|eukprot:XP_003525767.1 uncharacterized protein LOC100788494 [Glycine max]
MKLVWSPETASKAYIETVQSCRIFRESGVAELVSAMAAGWNAQLIVETWSEGGVMATSVGLAVARTHTGGRHVCVVPDERSRSKYAERMGEAGMSAEIVVGEAEEVMEGLAGGIDVMVVDSTRVNFSRVLRLAKLSNKGAVLISKNVNSATNSATSGFRWRSVLEEGSRRVVRSVYLPVGKGLEIAHVSAIGGGSAAKKWFKHVDQQSGEVHVIRR